MWSLISQAKWSITFATKTVLTRKWSFSLIHIVCYISDQDKKDHQPCVIVAALHLVFWIAFVGLILLLKNRFESSLIILDFSINIKFIMRNVVSNVGLVDCRRGLFFWVFFSVDSCEFHSITHSVSFFLFFFASHKCKSKVFEVPDTSLIFKGMIFLPLGCSRRLVRIANRAHGNTDVVARTFLPNFWHVGSLLDSKNHYL